MSIRQETVEKVLNILTEKPQTANEIANQYKPYKSCVSTVRRVFVSSGAQWESEVYSCR